MKQEINIRLDLITRKFYPKVKMVRFVISKDGVTTLDLNQNLPGRGFYINCENYAKLTNNKRLKKTLLRHKGDLKILDEIDKHCQMET